MNPVEVHIYQIRYSDGDGRCFECRLEFPAPNSTKALEIAREILGDCVSDDCELIGVFYTPTTR